MRRLAPVEPLRRGRKSQNDLSTSPDESFDATNHSRSKNTRAVHACESCRFLKVRCLSHINLSIQRCQRCARLNQECLVKPRAPRKPRKRTDIRVGELEQKVEALKAAFSMSSGSNRSAWSAADSNEKASSAGNQEHASVLEKGAFVNASPTSSEGDFQIPLSPSGIAYGTFPQHTLLTPASLSLGVLNLTVATKLFNKFQTDIQEHFPLELFPKGEDASVVREQKPTLFLTIITAAAGDYDLELHSILNDQLAEDFAKRIVFDGEKSVELVQALICAAAFYHPPDAFEKHKYYQYIHMAWNMATDLGLGRSGGPALPSKPQRSPSRNSKDELERNVSRRTLLASYMSCLS
jgi:Fungal Zn(2)-Cys(6) binuclear cluster domain